MEESILITIRRMIGGLILGVDPSEPGPFDTDLIIHINSVLQILNQLGVGREDFQITGPDEVWFQFLRSKEFKNLNMVKSLVYLRVKLLFDPPASATLMQAMKEQIAEMEWRLNTKVDRGVETHEQHDQIERNHKPDPRRHVLPETPPVRP